MIVGMHCVNEEEYVKRCVGDFHDESWVDRIIIIDGGSTDYTREELLEFPKVEVYVHPWLDWYHNMNAMQRNVVLSYIPYGELYLHIDFDERLNDQLKSVLNEVNERGELGDGIVLTHIARKTVDVLRHEEPYGEPRHAILDEQGWPMESHQIGQWPDPQPRLIHRTKPELYWVNSPHHTLCGQQEHFSMLREDAYIIHYEKNDAKHRLRMERKWARNQAQRKKLGLTADTFETRLKPEVAKYGEPEVWNRG